MKNFSYTKTPDLINKLNDAEDLRKTILLAPLSIPSELRLRYTSTIQTISLLCFLENAQTVDVKHIEKHIGKSAGITRTKDDSIDIYKTILDSLFFEYTGLKEVITVKDLDQYYALLARSSSGMSSSRTNLLQQILQYVQTSVDHPVLQSALIYGMIVAEQIYPSYNAQMGYLTHCMFLYKNGYGFRGITNISDYLMNQYTHYQRLTSQLSSDTNITPWLEFIIDGTIESLTHVHQVIISASIKNSTIGLDLNERQKQIVSLLNSTENKISNKTVQKLCNVSPITAARDLAKLVRFGMILPLGKGRSTYYTRV